MNYETTLRAIAKELQELVYDTDIIYANEKEALEIWNGVLEQVKGERALALRLLVEYALERFLDEDPKPRDFPSGWGDINF